jgi:hypothetical protein
VLWHAWTGIWYICLSEYGYSDRRGRDRIVFGYTTTSAYHNWSCEFETYQLPSHCSSLYVLLSVHKSLNAHINFPVIVQCLTPVSTIFKLYRGGQTMTWKLIWVFSDSCTESKTERDEKLLGSWYGHSVTCGLRVKRRETNNEWEVDTVHKSLNAHINFPVIFHLSPFYSQYTSHWMPISASQSLFVSLRFTLSSQVTECP